MRHPKFGKRPGGDRLNEIKKSVNYRDGAFQNQIPTPVFTEGVGYSKVLKEALFNGNKNKVPGASIPSKKTDLLNLDIRQDVLVWFGHSSYFIQIDGKRFLVDPVLSGYASPVSFTTKAFKGADIYKPEDIPDIDYLLITHDHWDHLDFKTIKHLNPKIKLVICGLGVGEHFEHWGYGKETIIEKDWDMEIQLDDNFNIYTAPARHFSGRGIKRNQTLWMSYVLQTPSMKIYIGGDGGYDGRFLKIGEQFGPFDLAIMENGQYNKNWAYIHTQPTEVIKAAKELNAKKLMTVHHSKFVLSDHPWHEPLDLITQLNQSEKLDLITPMIGEQVNLKDHDQKFTEWWKNHH